MYFNVIHINGYTGAGFCNAIDCVLLSGNYQAECHVVRIHSLYAHRDTPSAALLCNTAPGLLNTSIRREALMWNMALKCR